MIRPRRALAAALTAICALCAAPPAHADEDVVTAGNAVLRVQFAPVGGALLRWEACHPSCSEPRSRAEGGPAPGSEAAPALAIGLGSPQAPDELAERVRALRYAVSRQPETGGGERLQFVSELEPGVQIEQTYSVPAQGYRLRTRVALRGAGAREFADRHPLWFALGAPADADDEAAQARWVAVDSAGVRALTARDSIPPGAWSGVRARFWGLLAKSGESLGVVDAEARRLVLGTTEGSAWELELYLGPLERHELAAADPLLPALLFSGLWFWLRWLCLGLSWLLEALFAAVGSAGVAILLLSVAVKILLRPLTALAERWQKDADAKRVLLEPDVRRIKAQYRGEEQSRQLMALHQERGIHPLYGLKSGLGVLIQIPAFFAAYHTLEEAFFLSGRPFVWIADLARPDRVATLPFALPYFGDGVHLLPFVMAGVTVISSRLHVRESLSPELLRRQRLGLYGMAAAFFVLFYGFPAGMVLYWTTNGVTQLLREQWLRWMSPRAGGERPGVEHDDAREIG